MASYSGSVGRCINNHKFKFWVVIKKPPSAIIEFSHDGFPLKSVCGSAHVRGIGVLAAYSQLFLR